LTDEQTHGKHLPVMRVFLQAHFFTDRCIYSAPWLLHTTFFEISSDAAKLNFYLAVTVIPYHTAFVTRALIRGVASTIDRKLYSHIAADTIFFMKLRCTQER
jgi:hypothetical protein